MRLHLAFVALLALASGISGLAQSNDSESRTLLTILAEIRSIHEDIRATESTQILLTELEMQQSVVNRATEHFDDARLRLLQIQQDEKGLVAELNRVEEQLNQATDAGEQKHLTDEVQRNKSNLAALKGEEQLRATAVQEAQERLRNAQEALDSTQSELNDMLKRLSPGRK